MDAKVVIDISSIVWDENHFNSNKDVYYVLKSEVFLFLNAFESCNKLKLVAREELLNEIRFSFPYSICSDHSMFDFQRLVLQFLATKRNVSYNAINSTINSVPNICYSYFSADLKTEINYLITEVHNSSDNHIFCTFHTCWQNNKKLKTINKITKEYHTVIHKDGKYTIERFYLDKIRNVFEHYKEKHDRLKGTRIHQGKIKSPLSCFDGKDKSIPQKLLDTATQYKDDFFNYDDTNGTYVRFKNHKDNLYHGYDEIINNVPSKIRKEFHK